MKITQQIRLLLMCCMIIVLALCVIQYGLVSNTYSLKKEKYETDIKNTVSTVIRPYINSINSQTMGLLKTELQTYVDGRISKQQLLDTLQRKKDLVNAAQNHQLSEKLRHTAGLENVKYELLYTRISIERADTTDILPAKGPLVLTGHSFDTANGLLLSQGVQVAQYGHPVYTVTVRYAEYLNITAWQHKVLGRMAFTLISAGGLILAVMLLFYLVFRTLIRQKKLADMKTDFANSVTHELKTPLASLGVIVKSLENQKMREDPAILENLITTLDKQQKRLRHIVDSVLDSSLNDMAIKHIRVDMHTLLTSLQEEYGSVGHTFGLHIEENGHWLYTDPDKLGLILKNLLDNAFRYSPPNSLVTMDVTCDDGYYRLMVRDQGWGIAKEHQSRIFDQFYRVPQHKAKVTGLGLGLYLSGKAAIQLGGKLTVSSVPGNGSVFTLTLPRDEN